MEAILGMRWAEPAEEEQPSIAANGGKAATAAAKQPEVAEYYIKW